MVRVALKAAQLLEGEGLWTLSSFSCLFPGSHFLTGGPRPSIPSATTSPCRNMLGVSFRPTPGECQYDMSRAERHNSLT